MISYTYTFVSLLVFRVQALMVGVEPTSFGDDGGGEPRVPISNTAVKPSSADGTWTAGSWESRSLPSEYVRQAVAFSGSGLTIIHTAYVIYLLMPWSLNVILI